MTAAARIIPAQPCRSGRGPAGPSRAARGLGPGRGALRRLPSRPALPVDRSGRSGRSDRTAIRPDGRATDGSPGGKPRSDRDEVRSPVVGIVHRYPDRVLLKLVNACAVYCRFCFRRETVRPGAGRTFAGGAYRSARLYPGPSGNLGKLILTGGDPLVLSARRLKDIVARLAKIEHVKVIRVHTRMPVAAPERITAALVCARVAHRQGDLRRTACQSSAGIDRGRACRLCAPWSMPAFPMLSQSVAAATGSTMMPTRSARYSARSSRNAGIKAVLSAPCRIWRRGTAHLRTGIAEGQALIAGAARPLCRASVSRPMCLIFRAVTANRRSAQAI